MKQAKDKTTKMDRFYRLFCLILLSAKGSSNQIPVKKPETNVVSLTFCESQLPAKDKMAKKTLEEVHTYAELKDDKRASLPDSFTVCSSIMTTDCPSYKWPVFFNILDENRDQFMVPYLSSGVIESGLQIGFKERETQLLIGKVPPLFPNQWVKSCMAVNTTTGHIRWVVEGSLVMDEDFVEMKNSKSKNIILGARSYGGSWSAVSQKVTNLEIYSSPLSIEEMKRITSGGSCVDEGDYLAWSDMEWILHGQARMETTEKEETCEEKPLIDLYYTPFPGMDSCMHHCQNLGSRAPSVATYEEWTKLQTFLKNELFDKGLNTLQIWLPVEDRETEDVWKDFYTNQVVQNFTLPWTGSKPDGGKTENCARLMNLENWNDRRCDYPGYACMCSHKLNTNLKLRGLCLGSALDVYYKPMNKQSDIRDLKLQGLKHTSIEFAEQDQMWRLDVIDSNATGTSSASFASFTLGKHNWTIKGDRGCGSGDAYNTELKMSGCDEKEFTCNDGQCVSMDRRCDQLADCRDESDERNCNHLVLKDGYNKKVPPIQSSDPVNVSVTLDLLRLVDIDEGDYSIEIQFEIMLKWRDNRATFHNLKKKAALNALTQEDIEKLWLPEVIYENTDQKESTRIGELGAGEWKTDVIVRREEENGVMSGLESVDETEVFNGSRNSLVMNQTYTHTFHCNYELSHYPFDTQVLIYFLLFTFSLSFSDLRNRHGNEKLGIDHGDFSSWPNDYDPRIRYAYLLYY